MKLTELEQTFKNEHSQILTDWKSFLSFPSISANPAHNQDCRDCAKWLAARLAKHGFEVELVETQTKPFVFAQRAGNQKKPTVLFYGHYDVQPVDPLDDWTTPPFSPELRGDRLYARGAQDNKGQVFYTLTAIEALIANNALDVPLKILIEGEEEYNSQGLGHALDSWSEKVKADILLVHDTGTVQSGAPTIIMGLRGIVHITAELCGANHDLHSGVHGGLAPNAAQGIAQLTASLFDENGRVTIPGFYDNVSSPTPLEKMLANRTPFDHDAYRQQTGTTVDGGIRDLPPSERVGFLPSLDINGLHAGYGDAGMKTIIPSSATLKLTARLVPNQNPQDVLDAISEHLCRHTPAGMRLTISDQGIGGPGFRLNPESDVVNKAKIALGTLSDEPISFLWEGASIPIVAKLASVSGATPLLVGFGHEEDRIHAPNESFSLSQFKSGFLYTGVLLQML